MILRATLRGGAREKRYPPSGRRFEGLAFSGHAQGKTGPVPKGAARQIGWSRAFSDKDTLLTQKFNGIGGPARTPHREWPAPRGRFLPKFGAKLSQSWGSFF